MRNAIRRFVKDESGMEMVEWTIVAVVFAVAASVAWGTLEGAISGALSDVVDTVSGS